MSKLNTSYRSFEPWRQKLYFWKCAPSEDSDIPVHWNNVVSTMITIIDSIFDWLCRGLTIRQPLWVILCRLPEKRRQEIEETVEEMKERDREEKETGVNVKKKKKKKKTEEIKHSPLYPYLLQG